MNIHNNVFQLNHPSDEAFHGLFLCKSSISLFLSKKPAIDEDLMTFFVMLLNGDLADALLNLKSTVKSNVCFGYPRNDDDLNPHHNYQFQKDFNCVSDLASADNYQTQCSKLKSDFLIKNWPSICSKMSNDRPYQCVQLALKLMSETTNTYHYVAPVRNRSSSHWQLVDVMLPKSRNGLINRVDFFPQPMSKKSPEYQLTMWYAKPFGMLIKRNQVINNPKVLSYVDDMDPSGFDMEDDLKDIKDKKLFTSLDHQPDGDIKCKNDVKINHFRYPQSTLLCI